MDRDGRTTRGSQQTFWIHPQAVPVPLKSAIVIGPSSGKAERLAKVLNLRLLLSDQLFSADSILQAGTKARRRRIRSVGHLENLEKNDSHGLRPASRSASHCQRKKFFALRRMPTTAKALPVTRSSQISRWVNAEGDAESLLASFSNLKFTAFKR